MGVAGASNDSHVLQHNDISCHICVVLDCAACAGWCGVGAASGLQGVDESMRGSRSECALCASHGACTAPDAL